MWGAEVIGSIVLLIFCFLILIIHILEDSFVPHNYTDAQKIAFKFYIMIGQFNVQCAHTVRVEKQEEKGNSNDACNIVIRQNSTSSCSCRDS